MTTPARPTGRVEPTRRAQRTQERGDRTRLSIIEETIACVREEGFQAASAKHITERAGVTWGVIQYHFGGRDGLLMAVVDHGYSLLREAISAIEVPAGTVRDRVQAVVDAGWVAFSDPVTMAALEILVATRSDRDPVLDQHLVELGRRLSDLGRAIDPDHRDRRAVGDLLWATLRGLVLVRLIVRGPVDTTAERAALVDTLTAHLQVPASPDRC